MFIIWRGYGFMPIVFIMLGGMAGGFLQFFTHGGDFMIAIGLFLAAAANWFVGRRLNTAPDKILIDPATGKNVVFRRRHTLFFIPFGGRS